MTDEKKNVGFAQRDVQFTEIHWIEGMGRFRVVPVNEIEGAMAHGWRPVGMFRDLVTEQRERYVEPVQRNGSYWESAHYERVYVDRERMCALMVQDTTLMVVEYEQARQRLEAAAHDAMGRQGKAEEAQVKAQAAEAKLMEDAKRQQQVNDSLQKQVACAEKTSRKLEAALAKVRAAIGTKVWNEIMGAKEGE